MAARQDRGGARADHHHRTYHYDAFGLRIASDLLLPELGPPRAPPRAADLIIRIAPLSNSIPLGDGQRWSLGVGGEEAVLTVPKVGRYRIRGGREIAIEPASQASEQKLRLFLLGSAFGVLCHQRALLPLHANAIVVNGQAVAFAGCPGIGKSTLAAHFQSRGYAVLCDDVCVVSLGGGGRPLAWPGLPRLKLRRDAAEVLGHYNRTLERAADGFGKYHIPLARRVSGGPFPLERLYVLSDLAPGSTLVISPRAGAAAVAAIMSNTYRRRYLQPMGLTKANFLQAASVARHTQVFAAPRRRGFDVFEEEAARLERHFKRGNAARPDEAEQAIPVMTPTGAL